MKDQIPATLLKKDESMTTVDRTNNGGGVGICLIGCATCQGCITCNSGAAARLSFDL